MPWNLNGGGFVMQVPMGGVLFSYDIYFGVSGKGFQG
jgi:hypothetical protein